MDDAMVRPKQGLHAQLLAPVPVLEFLEIAQRRLTVIVCSTKAAHAAEVEPPVAPTAACVSAGVSRDCGLS